MLPVSAIKIFILWIFCWVFCSWHQNTHTLNILDTVLFKCLKYWLHVLSLFTSKYSSISTFKKTLTIDDINWFIQEDNLKCLIVEATNECSYGFNLSNDVEEAATIQVVRDKYDFTVGGLFPIGLKVLKSGIFTTVCLTKSIMLVPRVLSMMIFLELTVVRSLKTVSMICKKMLRLERRIFMITL